MVVFLFMKIRKNIQSMYHIDLLLIGEELKRHCSYQRF